MSEKYLVIGHNEESGAFFSDYVSLPPKENKDEFLKEALKKIREFSSVEVDHILIIQDDTVIEDRFVYEIEDTIQHRVEELNKMEKEALEGLKRGLPL